MPGGVGPDGPSESDSKYMSWWEGSVAISLAASGSWGDGFEMGQHKVLKCLHNHRGYGDGSVFIKASESYFLGDRNDCGSLKTGWHSDLFSEVLKMSVNTGDRRSAQCFRVDGKTESGPAALQGFFLLESIRISLQYRCEFLEKLGGFRLAVG